MGRLFGLPVVVTEHSTLFPRRELDRGMLKRARYAFSQAARVLPVSDSLKEAIEAYGIAPSSRSSRTPWTRLFHPALEPQAEAKVGSAKLMFVGRLEPTEHKGFPTLVAALEIAPGAPSDGVSTWWATARRARTAPAESGLPASRRRSRSTAICPSPWSLR